MWPGGMVAGPAVQRRDQAVWPGDKALQADAVGDEALAQAVQAWQGAGPGRPANTAVVGQETRGPEQVQAQVLVAWPVPALALAKLA